MNVAVNSLGDIFYYILECPYINPAINGLVYLRPLQSNTSLCKTRFRMGEDTSSRVKSECIQSIEVNTRRA